MHLDPSGEPGRPQSAATRENVRGSSLLTFGRMIAVGINMLVHVVVVRYFSVTEYGALAFALAAVSLGSSVAVFGMNKTMARFVPIYEEVGDLDRMFGAIAVGLGVMAMVGLGIVAGFFLFLPTLGQTVVTDALALGVMTVLVFMVPLQAFDGALLGLFAIYNSVRYIFWRRHIVAPLLGLAVILGVMVGGFDVIVYAVATVLVTLAALVIYAGMLFRVMQRRGLASRFHRSTIRFPVREMLGFSLPLLSNDVVYVMRRSAIVLLLGSMAGAPEVAMFSAVVPIANQNTLVLENFRLLYTPAASRLFIRGEGAALDAFYWQTTVWVVIGTFPFVLLSVALAGPLTTFLFGSEYSDAGAVLAILGVGAFVNSAFGHNGLTLRVFGRVRYLVTVDIITALLGVLAAIPLILVADAVGAAAAVLLINVVQNVLYQIGLARTTSVSGFANRYLPVYLGVAIATGVVVVAQLLVDPPFWVSLIMAGMVTVLFLALTRRHLHIGDTFPELLRFKLARMLLG